jgi:hypothetical protein
MDNAMSDKYPSQYGWSELTDVEQKEHYTNLLKDYRRAVNIIDAMCVMSKSYPIHD